MSLDNEGRDENILLSYNKDNLLDEDTKTSSL